MKLGILVPVWVNYRWMAPLTKRLLDTSWKSHPDLWFCGLEEAPGPDWNVIPMHEKTDRRNWSAVLRDGVEGLIARGYDALYIIAEEHIPIAPCREDVLNKTLPAVLDEWGAVYISLMGWDNRRYVSKSPVLDRRHFEFKHLVGKDDPRFHLHPALWKAEAALACCNEALRDPAARGSAWHFEKAPARPGCAIPEDWKERCYQIRASVFSTRRVGSFERLAGWCERFVFHKAMAVLPHLPSDWRQAAARRIPFDDVFCDGPYPMFYSGIMAKGGINRFFKRHVSRKNPELWREIVEVMPK